MRTTVRTVYTWKKRYERDGIEGSRKSKICVCQKSEIFEQLRTKEKTGRKRR